MLVPIRHGFTIGIVKDYCTRKLCLSASKNKRGCMLHRAHRIKALHAASSTSKEQRSMHIQRGRSHAFCNRYCDRIHTKEFSRRQRRRSYTIWLTRDSSMAHTRLLRTCLRHRTGDTSPLSKKLACPGRLLSKRLCMHRRSFLREQCMHRCILSPFSETLQTKAVEAGPSKDFFDPC